jgi:hypothetical protein
MNLVLAPSPLGEGWGGGFGPLNRCWSLVRLEPGVRPGGRVTFFASPKKVTKERRPHCLRPLRFAAGQPAVLAHPACRRTRDVHCVHSAQTAAASQTTKHACPSAGVRPAALRSSAQPGGSGSSLRCARPPTAVLRGPGMDPRLGSLRDVRAGPARSPMPSPQKYAPWRVESSAPLRVPRSAGAPAARLPKDRRASSSDLPQLSERSERSERSEFCGRPATRAPQVARSEAEGHAQWGRLSLLTFFGEAKKVSRPPGRTPGSGLGTTETLKQASGTPTQPPPRGGGE